MANNLGIAGLNTGMDTQATINQIMKYTKMPLDRLKQKQQSLIWKQEAYRSQSVALSTLKDMVFNLKLESSYTTKTVSSSNTNAVSAIASPNAANASYTVQVDQLATNATNSSSNSFMLRSRVVGTIKTSIDIDVTHNSFKITFDGIQKNIDLSDYMGTYTSTGTSSDNLTDLAAHIQTELNNEFGAGNKILVKVTSDFKMEFYTDDGLQHNITLYNGDANSVLSNLGFSHAQAADTTTINLNSTLWEQRDQFFNSDFFTGKNNTDPFTFSINGQSFTFKYANTLNEIITQINNSSTAGVRASYDNVSGKLLLTATRSGDYNNGNYEIVINDPGNVLQELFMIEQVNETGGKNAQAKINDVLFQPENNTISLNNVTFNLTGTTPAGSPALVTVKDDPSAIVTKITDFVNKYNEIIGALQGKVEEKRASAGQYKYYEPLTDEQKEELSDDQIKAWEEKAKQGLLYHDSILVNAINNIRLSMSRVVETPRTLTGNVLSGTINLMTNNKFMITVGSQTKEITLTAASYDEEHYYLLSNDLQHQLDAAFGANKVRVNLNKGSNTLSFTTQNVTMTLNNGSTNDGLTSLGFNSGATVKATYNTLSQIGITTGDYTENGKLYLDTDKLKAALENDLEGVLRLFTNNETVTPISTDPKNPDKPTAADIARAKSAENARRGFFYNLYDALDLYINKIKDEAGVTGTSSYSSRLGQELINNSTQMERVQKRINAEEDRLWKIFNQMEVMVGQMYMQTDALTQMLGNGK